MVWLAIYDDDILRESFGAKITYCTVNILPSAYQSY